MSVYAEDCSGEGGAFAPLTGSLLARKGEALPAVDAVAHEGVDIEMRPMRPANSPGAPKNISEDTIETLREERPNAAVATRAVTAGEPCEEAPRVRLVHSTSPHVQSQLAPPDKWTLPPDTDDCVSAKAQTAAKPKRPGGHRHAICKLRMPAPDLVRLRYASEEMEMSCQALILEALECYLDANDIPPSTDQAIKQEVRRLLRKASVRKRS